MTVDVPRHVLTLTAYLKAIHIAVAELNWLVQNVCIQNCRLVCNKLTSIHFTFVMAGWMGFTVICQCYKQN